MDEATFRDQLARTGCREIQSAALEPNEFRPYHAHDYEVSAMVLEGELTLVGEGVSGTYRTGETFLVPAGRVHSELVGSQGLRSVFGRRYAAESTEQ